VCYDSFVNRGTVTGRLWISAVLASLLVSSPSSAHHFFAPEYERELRGTIRGVVEVVRYVNPHVQVQILVTDSGAKTERWYANTVSPNGIEQRGWLRNTIQPDDMISVEGFLGKDASKRIWIQSITLESGDVLYPVGRESPAQ